MTTLSELPSIWAAAWIDDEDVLQDAYARILSVRDGPRRTQLLAELSDIPITRPDVLRQIADRKHIAADHTEDLNLWAARQRLAWGQRFAEHYRHVAEKAAGE